jgi:hypothetical protein
MVFLRRLPLSRSPRILDFAPRAASGAGEALLEEFGCSLSSVAGAKEGLRAELALRGLKAAERLAREEEQRAKVRSALPAAARAWRRARVSRVVRTFRARRASFARRVQVSRIARPPTLVTAHRPTRKRLPRRRAPFCPPLRSAPARGSAPPRRPPPASGRRPPARPRQEGEQRANFDAFSVYDGRPATPSPPRAPPAGPLDAEEEAAAADEEEEERSLRRADRGRPL